MARLICAPGIHMARIDADIVVLDVLADRYAALPEAAQYIDLAPDGRVRVTDAARPQLIEAGLLIEGEAPALRRRAAEPRRDLLPAPSRRTTDVLRAAAVLTSAALVFRRRPFARLIDPAPVLATDRPDPDVTARLVAGARAAWPWIPLEGQCLQRSYQLRALLARHGLAVDWVFGVRTWPFAAHCWLQSGDLVLNDTLDRVTRFTPILVA